MTRKYETIHRQEHSYPVALMCQWAGVSKSGYYSWRSRPESATTTRRRRLALFIKTEFSASDGTYGYRRITAALWRRGVVVDRDTVRSIMREQGLVAAQPRRKVRTTVPAADLGSRPDLVRRNFTANRPGVKWVGDITYIRTWEGFVYLATVPGCCTRKAVGHSTGTTTRPPPWSAMPSTRRPAVALPGRIRTPSGPAQSAHLRTALGPPGEPQHPPSGGQDRGAVGRVPGQSRSTPRRATRGPIRWCIPPGILPYGSRWNTTRSYSTPPWGTG